KPPTVAVNDSGGFLAYELHVTNLTPNAMVLRRVEVMDGGKNGKTLATMSDSALWSEISRPGVAAPGRGSTRPPPDSSAVIGAGLRATVYLWVRVDAADPPQTIRHRLSLQRPTDSTAQVFEGARVSVERNA